MNELATTQLNKTELHDIKIKVFSLGLLAIALFGPVLSLKRILILDPFQIMAMQRMFSNAPRVGMRAASDQECILLE